MKSLFSHILLRAWLEDSDEKIKTNLKDRFNRIFPPNALGVLNWKIRYDFNESDFILIDKTSEEQNINLPERIFEYTNSLRDDILELVKSVGPGDTEVQSIKNQKNQLFWKHWENVSHEFNVHTLSWQTITAPALRSIFTQISDNVFRLIREGEVFNNELLDFGADYESRRDTFFKDGSSNDWPGKDLLVGVLRRDSGKDFIEHGDGRLVPIGTASSGQQVLAPLLIILHSLYSNLNTNGRLFIIEEPEAHIFPSTQKDLVWLFAEIFNGAKKNIRFLITTHSPYILTSFNNLMLSGSISKQKNAVPDKIRRVIPQKYWIDPDDVAVYNFDKGTAKSIINKKTGLIKAEQLDTVSLQLARQFDKLLDLETNE
jgi:hypothetical protein